MSPDVKSFLAVWLCFGVAMLIAGALTTCLETPAPLEVPRADPVEDWGTLAAR